MLPTRSLTETMMQKFDSMTMRGWLTELTTTFFSYL